MLRAPLDTLSIPEKDRKSEEFIPQTDLLFSSSLNVIHSNPNLLTIFATKIALCISNEIALVTKHFCERILLETMKLITAASLLALAAAQCTDQLELNVEEGMKKLSFQGFRPNVNR